MPVRLAPGWLLLPIRTHVDLVAAAAALGANCVAAEIWDLGFRRIAEHLDQRSMSAGVIRARRNFAAANALVAQMIVSTILEPCS